MPGAGGVTATVNPIASEHRAFEAFDEQQRQSDLLQSGSSKRNNGGADATPDFRRHSTVFLSSAPRMAPLATLQLVLITSVFYTILILVFSIMGFGDELHNFLGEHKGLSKLALMGGTGGAFMMYVTDVGHWPRGGFAHDHFKPFAYIIVFGCLAVGGVLMADDYPAAPLAVFLCVMPVLLRMLKIKMFKKESLDRFIGSIAFALALESLICMLAWLVWVFMGTMWNSATKVKYAQRMKCDVLCLRTVNITGEPKCFLVDDLVDCNERSNGTFFANRPLDATRCAPSFAATKNITDLGAYFANSVREAAAHGGFGADQDCEAVYIVWFAPAICAIIGIIFSFFAHGLSRSLRQHKGNFAGRLFLGLFFLTMVGMWVAANIATAEMQLIGTMYGFVLSTFIIIALVLHATVGFRELRRQLMDVAMFKKLGTWVDSPWMQSMGIICGGPFIVVYLGLSFCNQCVRRSGLVSVSAPPFRVVGMPASRDVQREASHTNLGTATSCVDHINITGGTMTASESLAVKPEEQDKCFECGRAFTTLHRRHHCRRCGHSLCSEHSKFKTMLGELGEVRACESCSKLPPVKFTAKPQRPRVGSVLGEVPEWFTARAHAHLCAIFGGTDAAGVTHAGWMWTSVLTCLVYWGMIYLTLVVGIGKIVTLSLSLLNTALEPVPFMATTAIFFAIGLGMFLLPPVPGVPVYFTGGIILVKSATPEMGFMYALLFTIGVCFLIKCCAITLQQKAIGEVWGKRSVWVRDVVGVNSLSIRAIKLILQRPGLSWSKCAILCGGPDWPTSVLTGILRLSLLQMLLGSVPVLFLLAPCVCAGAFMLRVNEGDQWRSLSSVTLAVAAIVQTGALLAAMAFIEAEAAASREALEAIPRDEEVLAISERRSRNTARYREVTRWSKLPRWARWCLGSSAALMLLVMYVVGGLGDSCFETFAVTDSLEEKLGGNAFNLMKPLGVKAVYAFLLSCVLLFLFQHWAKRQVKRRDSVVDGGKLAADEDLSTTHTWREQILKERGAQKPGTVKKKAGPGGKKHHGVPRGDSGVHHAVPQHSPAGGGHGGAASIGRDFGGGANGGGGAPAPSGHVQGTLPKQNSMLMSHHSSSGLGRGDSALNDFIGTETFHAHNSL